MAEVRRVSLLTKYFKMGWLERRYFDGHSYCQHYSAEDRLNSGERLYEDFCLWRRGARLITNYNLIRVDVSLRRVENVGVGAAAERFRKALKQVSRCNLPVIYKIVLDEKEIRWPKELSARERIYFNEEIKGLLCRGLDELCAYYQSR